LYSFQYLYSPFLLSKTDWNGNVITYVFDFLGLKLSCFEVMCTPHERTITTEWHAQFRLHTKVTEPTKITEYSYDAQGRQLTSKVSSVQ